MIPDYHIHTKLCKHAAGEMHEYVESALEKGFKEIAFTDHIPLPDNFDIAHRMTEKELEFYLEEINRLSSSYPEITIKTGIEADYYNGHEAYLEKILARFDFDLVILSIHFVHGWPEGNWAFVYDFPERTLQEVYSDYLRALMRGIKCGLFDIVGHLDLVKSPEQSLIQKNTAELEQIFKLAKQENMAVEINTSGLRKKIGQPYPAKEIIPLILKHDLPLTLGSDAHKPEQIGFSFLEITEHLQRFEGIKFASFEKRRMDLKEYQLQ